MRVFVDVAWTGVAAVAMHPLRSLATIAVLCVVLTPFLVGMGLSQGVQREAERALAAGPDLYVTATRVGRPTPVPLSVVAELRRLPGVERVTPRIVGPVALGRERIEAVVVGLPAESLPDERFPTSAAGSVSVPAIVEGRLFADDGTLELVVGAQLARRLNVRPGDRLPPFYRSRRGERVARVVGVFRPEAPLWQAKLIFTSFAAAAEIFDETDAATDLLVDCREGYAEQVREAIVRKLNAATRSAGTRSAGTSSAGISSATTSAAMGNDEPRRYEVVSREQYRARMSRGFLHRDGVVNLHYVLLFAGGILVVLVTSGAGLDQRRREVAILKATGWQTDEVLIRGLAESLVLSVGAAGLSIVVAFVWLRVGNGWGIARLFLAGADASLDFEAPFQLSPWPALGVLLIALATTLSGTLTSTWRAAIAPPWQAMR